MLLLQTWMQLPFWSVSTHWQIKFSFSSSSTISHESFFSKLFSEFILCPTGICAWSFSDHSAGPCTWPHNHEVCMGPVLKAVRIPLNGIPYFLGERGSRNTASDQITPSKWYLMRQRAWIGSFSLNGKKIANVPENSCFFLAFLICVRFSSFSWRAIMDNLMTHDKTTFRDLMSKY